MKKDDRRKYYIEHRDELLKQARLSAHVTFVNMQETDRIIMEADELLNTPDEKRYKPQPISEDELYQSAVYNIDNNLYLEKEYNHTPFVFGADISSILESIRNCDHEIFVMIACKDNCVIDTKYIDSYSECSCDVSANDCIKFKESNKDCELFALHNHPIVISAKPSVPDEHGKRNFYEKYGFSGYGVVTKFDFYKDFK